MTTGVGDDGVSLIGGCTQFGPPLLDKRLRFRGARLLSLDGCRCRRRRDRGLSLTENRFLDAIETDRSIDPKSLKINSSVVELVERIARAYGLRRWREA
ncbi:MAG: hypothetical protein FJY54_14940 [Betaproteobacteria bacterium]|nr:hypothetical protein [Betaproteobacteria bacterium]